MLDCMEDYYWRMAGRGRLISLTAGASLLGVCTFFVLPSLAEVPRYYHRKTWSLPEDVEDGAVLYLDKLVTYRWNLTLARQIETELTHRIPSWEVAVWFRPTAGDDRRYEHMRRR